MNVFVIGGGAAGMFASIFAAKQGAKVTIIEKNEKLGKKLYITGKGRCNLTNYASFDEYLENIVSNPKFMYGALKSFDCKSVMDFFEKAGVGLKVERGNRVFPQSDKSSDIIKALTKEMERYDVAVHLNEKVVDLVQKDGQIDKIITDLDTYFPDKVILATGGVSYPATGSTGDGYNFAKKLGHTIIPLRSALVPINLKSVQRADGLFVDISSLPKLQGLSLKNINLSACNTKKILVSEFGEMLFTNLGISGPTALSLSSKINRQNLNELLIKIDLKPALTMEELDARVLRDFATQINKAYKNSLNALLPSSLIPFVIGISQIDEFKPVNLITKEERTKLVYLLKNLTFTIANLDKIELGIVTAGGISTKEIAPSTMQSKLINNLYFAGEIIDVDALTGGFNLQIAFSTAYLAANKNTNEVKL